MTHDPTRDCEHGRLKGKCDVCDLQAEVERLKATLALYKMAEDAVTIGLSYNDWPKIGCVNHDCDQCKAVQEPEIDLRKQWPMNGWKENKPAAQKPWVGLDSLEVSDLWLDTPFDDCTEETFEAGRAFVEAIEAKLKEKNT
jgi:hypothetical protein